MVADRVAFTYRRLEAAAVLREIDRLVRERRGGAHGAHAVVAEGLVPVRVVRGVGVEEEEEATIAIRLQRLPGLGDHESSAVGGIGMQLRELVERPVVNEMTVTRHQPLDVSFVVHVAARELQSYSR